MLTRRHFLATGLAAAFATPAWSVSTNQASQLVTTVASEITTIMNKGGSRAAAIGAFENVFKRYADVSTISRSVLGPVARSTSNSDLAAFGQALTGYLARKYGAQFLDFGGGTIEIKGARDRGRFVEVSTTARTAERSSVAVSFRVWDKTGAPKFIDMLVEGISFVTTERSEIGALLDQRGGSVARLTRDLKSLG